MILSVPSWVVPGTYLENLRFLDGHDGIAGVELLFFLYDEGVRAELDAQADGIRAFSRRFRFTAHLPDRVEPAHEELVARLSPFVDSFVVHPPKESSSAAADAFARLLRSWADRWGDRFFLENTQGGRLEAVAPLLPDFPLCLDTGHALLEGKDPAALAEAWGKRVREIHLHAVDEGAAAVDGRLPDHRPLKAGKPWLDRLLPFLASFGGVVDLEVFSWAEAAESARVLGSILPAGAKETTWKT